VVLWKEAIQKLKKMEFFGWRGMRRRKVKEEYVSDDEEDAFTNFIMVVPPGRVPV
jgi:hypothetical protein